MASGSDDSILLAENLYGLETANMLFFRLFSYKWQSEKQADSRPREMAVFLSLYVVVKNLAISISLLGVNPEKNVIFFSSPLKIEVFRILVSTK